MNSLGFALADSPWGPIRIAATDRGILAVSILSTRDAFDAMLRRRGLGIGVAIETGVEARGAPAHRLALLARDGIQRFVAGEDVPLGALPIDWAERPAWDRAVLGVVRGVPRGSAVSYGEVARMVGRPGAARAVGGAVGRNPVGLLVPCHRVIAADGTLGGYGVAAVGGREAALDVKRRLLALEGVSAG